MYQRVAQYPGIRKIDQWQGRLYGVSEELALVEIRQNGLHPVGRVRAKYEPIMHEYNGILVYADQDAIVATLNLSTGEEHVVPEVRFMLAGGFGKYVLAHVGDDQHAALYDVSTWRQAWSKPYELRLMYMDASFLVGCKSRDFSKVSLFDVASGDEKWSFDFATLPTFPYQGEAATEQIGKCIGITPDAVWLTTKGNRIIGVGLEDGVLLKLLEFPKEPGQTFVPRAAETYLDASKIVLQQLSTYYLKVALPAGTIERKVPVGTLLPELQNVLVASTRDTSAGISFTASPKGSGQAKYAGVFTPADEQLAWFQELELEKGAFIPAGNAPVWLGNQFFILDSTKKLSVYSNS